jgi:hypothetical protein
MAPRGFRLPLLDFHAKNAFLTNDLDASVSIIRIIGCLPTDVLQHRGVIESLRARFRT